MIRARVAWCVIAGACLALAGCGGLQAPGEAGDSRAAAVAAREKGVQDAERDRDKGILKLKEYPPLPYSLDDIRYIQLLKKRCGVEHEVQSAPGNDKSLRAEVEGYNSVMTAAIRQKYGADILTRLREEAGRR